MEIFSYVMVRDTGCDPNPCNGTLDLISCKPKIRKKAKKGDILVGTGSTRSKWSKKLIYAAIIDEEIPAKKYTFKRCFTKKGAKRRGCAVCSVNKSLKGKNVLRCKRFWYFGESAMHITPESLKAVIHKGRGHSRIGKEMGEKKLVKDFYKWIRKKDKGIYGTPIGNLFR